MFMLKRIRARRIWKAMKRGQVWRYFDDRAKVAAEAQVASLRTLVDAQRALLADVVDLLQKEHEASKEDRLEVEELLKTVSRNG